MKYPYEYMTSLDKFSETKLTDKDNFKLSLGDYKVIELKDYPHTSLVWKELGIKTLGEYHYLYLKTDMLLLTDVCEGFRRMGMKNYELDPYIITPHLVGVLC